MSSKTIKNAFIFLIINKNRVLLVQEINGKWGLPGGGLNIGEHPYTGMSREFKEETTFNLPKLYNNKKFNYHNHSRIYYNKTNVKFGKFEPKFVLNNEIKALKYVKLNQNIILRKEFRKSLNEMVIDQKFKIFIIIFVTISAHYEDLLLGLLWFEMIYHRHHIQ